MAMDEKDGTLLKEWLDGKEVVGWDLIEDGTRRWHFVKGTKGRYSMKVAVGQGLRYRRSVHMV